MEKVLSGEDQSEQNAEYSERRSSLVLVDVAALQGAPDILIEKDLMNLVFTGNDV